MFNLCGAETRIYHENKDNTVAADDLAPSVTKLSVAIALVR